MPKSAPWQQFGPYRLERKIAQGGMAEAWKARWQGAEGVQRSVLIKRIKRSISSDPKFVKLFISEAHVSAGLSHGNIAQVFDFGEVGGEYYLAMEFVDGPSLAQVLKRLTEKGHKLPPPLALFIAMEMCKGLHYAHTHRDDEGQPLHIVHRDVSPDNVLISYEGQVKLIDFGIARARVMTRPETEAGVVRGKFLYFSPEQSRGESVDAATDVWAVGVVLYLMLCGRLPFAGQVYEVIRKLQYGEYPNPSVVNPELTDEMESLVLKAMGQTKTQRFRSAQHFHDAMGEVLHRDYPGISTAYLAAYLSEVFGEELKERGRAVEVSAPVKKGLEAMKTGQTRSKVYAQAQSQVSGPALPEVPPAPLNPTSVKLWMGVVGLVALGLLVAGLLMTVGPRGPSEPVAAPSVPDDWATLLGKQIIRIKQRGATQPLQTALYPALDELKRDAASTPADRHSVVAQELGFIDAALGGPQFTGTDVALFEEWLLGRAASLLEQNAFDSALSLLQTCPACRGAMARARMLEPERRSFDGLADAALQLKASNPSGAREGLRRATDTDLFAERFAQLSADYQRQLGAASLPPDVFVAEDKSKLIPVLARLRGCVSRTDKKLLTPLLELERALGAATRLKEVEAVKTSVQTLSEAATACSLSASGQDTQVKVYADQARDALRLAAYAKGSAQSAFLSVASSALSSCVSLDPRAVACEKLWVVYYDQTKDRLHLCQHAKKSLGLDGSDAVVRALAQKHCR